MLAEGEVKSDDESESDESLESGIKTAMATSVQINPPEPFDFSCPADWPRWIRRFERFRIATTLDGKEEEYQVNSLLYAMGDAADDVLDVLPLTDADKKKYEAVKAAFDQHYVGKHNIIFERAQFNSRRQQDGESAEAYITAVHKLAEHCGFGVLKDELIRDRIVVGIRDKRLSERLQMDSDLTLAKAIQNVRLSETVKKQQTILHSSAAEDSVSNMDAIRTNTKMAKKQTWQQSKGQRPDRQGEKECGWCGRKKHSWKDCPARDVECRKCQKKGHFAIVCRSGEAVGLREVIENQDDTDSDEYAFLGEIGTEKSEPWREKVEINGEMVNFKLDTGADVTSIPESLYKPERDGELRMPKRTLLGPSRYPLKVRGCFKAEMAARGRCTSQNIYLVSGLEQPLLSRSACEALGLVYRVDTVAGTETDFRAAYPEVFQGLGKLKEPYHIEIEQGATPVALSAPRRVPLPLREAVHTELNRMEEMGVISKVTEPTAWCSGMVVVPKPGKKSLRICVDLTPLNAVVKRERHILPAVDQTLAMMKDAKVFTKLDARSGFWQIPITPESRPLTTFITPFGRYQFNRLPFGIASAPEHFQRRMSQMLEDFDGIICHADDVLVYGRDREEHDQRLHCVLQKFRQVGLTLNEKCEFAREEIMFVGHKVTANGIEPDPNKVKAIQQLPQPTCVEDVRRLMGMANYLAKFMPQLATITTPLKELQKERNEWIWAEPQETAFQRLKDTLSSPEVLAQYSNTADTRVAADASPYGIGAVLTQKQADGSWRPVTYISRGLTDTEKRYAQIEKEALAVTWACERLTSYLMGLHFTLVTDHKPLVPLLSTRGLDDLPPRVLRFRLRLLRFSFDIVHVPGKNLVTADALSRAPLGGPPSAGDLQLEKEVEVFIDCLVTCLPATDKRLEEIRAAQNEDEVCNKVTQHCLTGWPEKCNLDPDIKPYWQYRTEFHLAHGLLMKGERLVIPAPLRVDVLQRLHVGHQGISKCRARARESVWWPGISAQIGQIVERCELCQKHRTQNCEPLLPTPVPDRPWQKVGMDLFEWSNKHYLLIIDFFSRYIEIAELRYTSAEVTVRAIKEAFARHGTAETVVSDNGPQFSSELFRQFAKEHQFAHVTSSPRYPQANGEAERAVRTIKDLWKKDDDHSRALQAYRATPLEHGFSPAQLLMGRNLRTSLPQPTAKLDPKWPDLQAFREKDEEGRWRQAKHYNRRHRSRPLPELPSGQKVWITTERSAGTVVRPADTPRSYVVETDRGFLRRNRSHLRPTGTVTRSGRVSKPPERMDL